MSGEPRYSEEEVREIFELATTTSDRGDRALPPAEGLSLTQIQEIGREVGLTPEQIAQAASALEVRRSALPRGTSFGMPVSVGRSVWLDRAPSDSEWELLLAELRATFRARGRDRSSGHVRHWSNSNLHAIIEPAENGYRLRMGTTKGDATGLNFLGVGSLLVAAILAVLMMMGGMDTEIIEPILFALVGGGALTRNAMTLPRWADEREEQMAHIAARARALTALAPGDETAAANDATDGHTPD